MTENKRYVVRSMFGKIFIEDDIKRVGVLIGYEEDGKKDNIVKVTNVLNQLNDENEQLKTDLDYFKTKNGSLETGMFNLKRENDELKQSISHYANITACSIQVMNEDEELKKDYASILCTKMEELVKENEQLKQQNKNLLEKLKFTTEQINYSENLRKRLDGDVE